MSNDYQARVDRVIDHIRQHLDEDLSLARLSKVAHFSPYHFHRIFKAMTGETVAEMTRRARLERAVHLMRGAPSRSLSSIALEVGFGAPSDLSRLFRQVYGQAPSRWDRVSRLDGKRDFTSDLRETDPVIEVPEPVMRKHDAVRVAYVRVRDPWQSTSMAAAYARLTTWLASRGVTWTEGPMVGMTWDRELATPLEKITYDLGFAVRADLSPGEGFGIVELPAMRCVEVRCHSLPQIAFAWDRLYHDWLPSSPWEPEDVPVMKRFVQPPKQFGPDAWHVDCSIALRPRQP